MTTVRARLTRPQRVLAAVLASSVVLGGLAVAAPSVAGAVTLPSIVSATRSTSLVVVGISGKSNALTMTAHVVDPNGLQYTQWFLETAPGRGDGPFGLMTLKSGTKFDGVWTATWRQVGAPIGGAYRLDYLAVGTAGLSPYKYLGTTYLKRDSRFTLYANPNPVKAGKALTISGTLKQVFPSLSTGVQWKGLAAAGVQVDFRLKGKVGWTKRAVRTTNGNGDFRAAFTARSDGTWRVTYRGSSRVDRATAQKFVDVR